MFVARKGAARNFLNLKSSWALCMERGLAKASGKTGYIYMYIYIWTILQ